MADWLIDVIKVTIGVSLALLAHWIAFVRLKWKLKQDRKTKWAEKSSPIYAEGLEFIYAVEQNQANHDELDRIIEKWKKWFPPNANTLPSSVVDAILKAMYGTSALTMSLHNQDSSIEIRNTFKEKLQTAKMMLLESKDIGWLPEDLR